MKLKIINPSRTQEFTVVWLEINTPAGNMVIQNNHAPMMVKLNNNEEIIFQTDDGKQHTITIQDGFAHITRSDITILADA